MKITLKRKNTIELENEELKHIIKNELYKQFIENYKINDMNKYLIKENKKLRLKIKEMRRIINGNKR